MTWTVTRGAVAAALLFLAVPLSAAAQVAGNVHHIGYLSSGSSPAVPHTIEAFRQGLRGLGWVEGQNVVIDYRFAEGRFDRLPGLAAELVRRKVEVIVAGPSPAAVAAKNATGTIPIVMWGVGDPIGLGLIASLARPASNVTGTSFTASTETFAKGLELLKEAVPKVRRVAVLSNPANPSNLPAVTTVKAAGRSLGVDLQLLEARSPADFDGVFAAMARERAGALLIITDTVFFLHRGQLANLATKRRLPSMHGVREYVEAGGLMSYGPSTPDLLRLAATFVDKIFKGSKPADLPVQQPTKFELVINLRTTKALGLTLPSSLLARADHVIE